MTGRRYQILSELGRGGMGTVFRATDRLTGWLVALKQVHHPGHGADERPRLGSVPSAMGTTSGNRLTLAREFRLLASLRHPHIISVLDYGFDSKGLPFYTMELMEHPVTLLEAAREEPLERRLGLVAQTLQALAYLHRRGVIHRDVKPSNVLVGKHHVKLVDFGISEQRENVRAGVSGSIPYLAPEVLDGRPASEAADLYALGVMTYELLSGHHPFESDSMPILMVRTMREAPELTTKDFDARVIPILERLLAKDPERRYSDAAEVIRDLASATGLEISGESDAIRDSFLQSARLVGRKAELRELTELWHAALQGRGSAVLVGGESGVGKSRLLDELRTVALVEGALVLPGQAVHRGGSPYQLWRQVLRWLVLLGDPDATAAAVLKPQVPDLASLLGRRAGDASELDPQATQSRFLLTVEELFQRLEQPAVVLLEDLHWAGSESLALWARLRQATAHLPLLLVGTFRDDERGDLPELLPGSTVIKLERFRRDSIAELGESMLGPAGREPAVLDLLQRESAGNAFFLVEVARALAAEAGRRDRIDAEHLPEQVSTGNIERLIQRRLNRLPKSSLALLELAAVAGRALDTELLAGLAPGTDLPGWLKACAEVAVLEVAAGHWRFAHDRVREMLLHDLPADRRRKAHRQVAQAILQVHGESREHVASLAHHWAGAADVGDPEATGHAVDYLARAGRDAMASCANQQATEILAQGLQLHGLLVPTPERLRQEIRIQVDLGATYLMSRGFTAPEVGRAFGRARALSEQTGDTAQLMPALLGLWRFHVVRGEFDTTRRLAEEMLRHAESSGNTSQQVLGRYALGTTQLFQGEPAPAAEHLRECVRLFESLHSDSHREIAAAAFYLGQNPGVAALDYASWALWCLGYPDQALELNRRGLALAHEIAHPFSQAFARTLLTWLSQMRNDPGATEEAAAASIELCQEQGFPYFLAVSSIFQGWARARRGRAEAGIAQIKTVLDGLRAAGSELFRPYFLALLAEAYGEANRPEEGLGILEEALQDVELRGGGWWEPEMYRVRGELHLSMPTAEAEQAENAFLKALHRARWRRERALELRAVMSLVRLWESDSKRSEKARSTLRTLYEGYTEGFETPDLIEARRLLDNQRTPRCP